VAQRRDDLHAGARYARRALAEVLLRAAKARTTPDPRRLRVRLVHAWVAGGGGSASGAYKVVEVSPRTKRQGVWMDGKRSYSGDGYEPLNDACTASAPDAAPVFEVLARTRQCSPDHNATHRFGGGRALERHGVAGAEGSRL